jgi:hypothetical protein
VSPRLPLLATTVVAAAWIAGIALLPRALEPGRSERGGIRLSPLTVAAGGDWYPAQALRISPAPNRLSFVGGPVAGLQLVSRPLAVFAGRRYRVVFEGSANGSAELDVWDARVRRLVAAVVLGPRPVETSLSFSTDGLRRVSLVIESGSGVAVSISRPRLASIG